MEKRTIKSIKVLTSKYAINVYVNFDNDTYGMRIFEDSKWRSYKLTDEELAEAKKLALVDKKWTNWQAPRKATSPVIRSNRIAEDEPNALLDAPVQAPTETPIDQKY